LTVRSRFSLSVVMLLAGAALLAAAGLARPQSRHAGAKKGGTLRLPGEFGDIDPQRQFDQSVGVEWFLGRMLLNHAYASGGRGYRLFPDGASRYSISNNGRTYTFHIRHGMRFSDRSPITAANYRWAFLRILDPHVSSPVPTFFTDPASVDIVGGADYNTGKSTTVAGLRTKGKYTFVIELVNPTPLLLSLVAMPITAAVPTGFPMQPITKLTLGRFKQLPSGGAYYIAKSVPHVVIKKNPYYHGRAPARLNEIAYRGNLSPDQTYSLINSGGVDWARGGLDPHVYARLGAKYGTKRGRFRVTPISCEYYLVMNTSRPTFSSVRARRALNYAIDRTTLAGTGGAYGLSPTDQTLPPSIPGYRNATIYPVHSNFAKAQKLARGHTGQIRFWHVASPRGIQWAHLVEGWLARVGFHDIQDTTVPGLPSAIGERGAQFDLAAYMGWCADYPDPYDFMTMLNGETIRTHYNLDVSYFDNRTVNKRLDAAARLRPPKRFRVYGKLDVSIMKKYAPWAPVAVFNSRDFFSARVDPKSIQISPLYGVEVGRLTLERR
jgi:ABC-type transport system substrate-binding protein